MVGQAPSQEHCSYVGVLTLEQQQISRLHYRSRSVALSHSILEVHEVGFANPFQRCMRKPISKYRDEMEDTTVGCHSTIFWRIIQLG